MVSTALTASKYGEHSIDCLEGMMSEEWSLSWGGMVSAALTSQKDLHSIDFSKGR
jgi:hypothetical protein